MKVLKELYEQGEVSLPNFKDKVVLKKLKENGIVKLVQVGKTRAKVKLLDRSYLAEYLALEYSFDVKSSWEEVVLNSSLPKDLQEVLLCRPIQIKGKSDLEVITNIKLKLSLIRQGLTYRQISAILFWGLSKILDNREDIVTVLDGIAPAVMLNVCSVSSEFSQVVFIENYDTYVEYINNKKPDGVMVVFSAGFSSSTSRIRNKKGCSLHYSKEDNLSSQSRKKFEKWLFQESNEKIPIFFFGDFDFSGISIFSSLRNVFPEIKLYKAAYERMVREVQNGNGHSPEMALKDRQKDPYNVNDTYCDETLLPIMRKYGFFDQEGIL